MIDSEISMTVYQAPVTPREKKRRALSSFKKMVTSTLINISKSMLLKAKTVIKRVMKKEIDYVNKVNLELVILDLQITLN